LVLDAVNGAFTSLGETKQLRAIVTDASGQIVTNIPVDWVSTDPTIVSVNDLGMATAIANGGTQITAQVATLTATVDVFVIQTTASLAAAGGDGQTGSEGVQLAGPLVVSAFDALGSPVADVAITWNVLAGGGSVTPTEAVTNGGGNAQTFWTLGPAGSVQVTEARLSGGGGLRALFAATSTAAEPAGAALGR
jgi:hypothetical protein